MFNSQAKEFKVFFLTEMWERYGFYIIQTLLVFYAVEVIKLSDSEAYFLVGSFTALAYINSIFGGFIADRLLKYDKTIIIGAILLAIGYFILALSQGWTFYLGLSVISLGTGLLKPNISSMLSQLYIKKPQKKDQAYTIFYIGIYFGAVAGSFLGGFFKTHLGWNFTFLTAAVGLLISLIIFSFGTKKYQLKDLRNNSTIRFNQIFAAVVLSLILIVVAFLALTNPKISDYLFAIIVGLSVVYTLYNIFNHQGVEKKRLIAFGVLTIFSIFYWAVYFQMFLSVSLCTARVTKLSLPASSLSSFESLGIILFGPLVGLLWAKLEQKNYHFSIASKFSISFLFNSLSFLILILSLNYAISANALQSQWFIITAYLVLALGELFIAPIGLAMISSLVPIQLQGAKMGLFLMSIGLGGKLAGSLAQNAINATSTNLSLTAIETIYRNSFIYYLGLSAILFIICILAIKPINYLIRDQNDYA